MAWGCREQQAQARRRSRRSGGNDWYENQRTAHGAGGEGSAPRVLRATRGTPPGVASFVQPQRARTGALKVTARVNADEGSEKHLPTAQQLQLAQPSSVCERATPKL